MQCAHTSSSCLQSLHVIAAALILLIITMEYFHVLGRSSLHHTRLLVELTALKSTINEGKLNATQVIYGTKNNIYTTMCLPILTCLCEDIRSSAASDLPFALAQIAYFSELLTMAST